MNNTRKIIHVSLTSNSHHGIVAFVHRSHNLYSHSQFTKFTILNNFLEQPSEYEFGPFLLQNKPIIGEYSGDITCVLGFDDVGFDAVIVGYSNGFVRIFGYKTELLLSEQINPTGVKSIKIFHRNVERNELNNSQDDLDLYILFIDKTLIRLNFGRLVEQLRVAQQFPLSISQNKGMLDVSKNKIENQDIVNDVSYVSSFQPLEEKRFLINRNVSLTTTTTSSSSTSTTTLTKIEEKEKEENEEEEQLEEEQQQQEEKQKNNDFQKQTQENEQQEQRQEEQQEEDVCQRFISVGSNPMIGFYSFSFHISFFRYYVSQLRQYAISWIPSPLKSIGSYYYHKSNTNTDIIKDYPQSLYPDSSLSDSPRVILRVVSNWNGKLLICSDSFGRALLINPFHGTIIRVWKGYRDVQACFCSSSSLTKIDKKSGENFLVMFLPERMLIEVWRLVLGKRVFVAKVDSLFGKEKLTSNDEKNYHLQTLIGKSFRGKDSSACVLLNLETNECVIINVNNF